MSAGSHTVEGWSSSRWRPDGEFETHTPVWSPDGRDLFYLEVPERIMVAEVETDPTFNSGTPTEAFDAVPYAPVGPR